MITIIKDIDLILDIKKYDVILVGVNVHNVMGNGFSSKIRIHYPETHKELKKTRYADKSKLGSTVTVPITPIFELCFIVGNYNARPDLYPDYLNYEALESCMKTINEKYKGLNIGSTILGISKFDGNGDRERIMKILDENSNNINLFLYDYVQLKSTIEMAILYKSIVNNPDYTPKMKYDKLMEIKAENDRIHIYENFQKRAKRIRKELRQIINKN